MAAFRSALTKNPRRLQPLLRFDQRLRRQQRLKLHQVAGLDEAGRGPLAGPIVASAVILRNTRFSIPIDDSKRLTPSAREKAFKVILTQADIGVGSVLPEQIDQLGIEKAWSQAMYQAVTSLTPQPDLALIDGHRTPAGFPVQSLPVVGGDGRSLVIAAASIIAKVIRDRMMYQVDQLVPEYRFGRHKGYGTQEHMKILRKIGPSPFHRYTFHPIRKA